MISIDTNILFHAWARDSSNHEPALEWINSIKNDTGIAVSEFVRTEFYRLLRNPVLLKHPLSGAKAVDVIQSYREHPRWRLIGFPNGGRTFHEQIWEKARERGFAFRRIYDVRFGFTLIAQGVTELATVNVKDFQTLGSVVSGIRLKNTDRNDEQPLMLQFADGRIRVTAMRLGLIWSP